MPKKKPYADRSILYEQTAAKTSGPPLISTRFQDGTGDAIFTKQITQLEYDTVVNQIYLKEENQELLETVQLLGEVTNRRSSSGPLVGTMKIVTASSDGSLVTIFRPDEGEIWEVNALSQTRTSATASTTTAIYVYDGTNLVMVEELADNSGAFPLNVSTSQPLRLSYENYLVGAYSSSSSASAVNFFCSVVRVR